MVTMSSGLWRSVCAYRTRAGGELMRFYENQMDALRCGTKGADGCAACGPVETDRRGSCSDNQII